jgi:hypothetical protein
MGTKPEIKRARDRREKLFQQKTSRLTPVIKKN